MPPVLQNYEMKSCKSMDESEKIKGGAILKLFEQLRHQKTLLKLSSVDSDDERPTRIAALENRNGALHFIIHMPKGLDLPPTDFDGQRLYFEFTGNDHIKYTFMSAVAATDGKRIYVQYPRVVERWQRRDVFRINAPAGTKLCLTRHAEQYALTVINISIGGMLAAWVRTRAPDLKKPPFADIQLFRNIGLVFPAEIMQTPIRIKTARIKRMKKKSEKTAYEVALEFDEIDGEEEKRLTDLIYRLQRQQLRDRLPLGT